MFLHTLKTIFQTCDQSCPILILHDFHLTQEIFYGFLVRAVAQHPWKKTNAENLICNYKISDTIVNGNAVAISKMSIIILLLAISKHNELQVPD